MRVDVDLTVQLLVELGDELRSAVAGDMLGESVKALYLVDVCVCNICCCSGCICWMVGLYIATPIFNNVNCVEVFRLW